MTIYAASKYLTGSSPNRVSISFHKVDKSKSRKVVIDLTGPDGNAVVLLGMASRFGKTLNMNKEEIDKMLSDMRSSDYEHLLEVFEKHFGDYVDMYRS